MIEIDVIGALHVPAVYGAADTETGIAIEITPATPLPGWHANITPFGLVKRPDLAPYVVTPSRLRRVWAGDDPLNPTATVAMRFADEAEATATLALTQ